MKRYRSALPPLDSLIFFEAARRTGGFTRCAAELHVSQAAVSKRIRHLEEWVGQPLFIRQGKRLLATDSGDKLYETVGMALEFLRQGLGSLREESLRPLSVAANTGIGMFWLTPHLQAFGRSDDACPMRLITSDNGADLFSSENDLVIAYGNGAFPGWRSTRLLDEELTPVATPAVAKQLRFDPGGSFARLQGKDGPPLLNYARSGPDWVDWKVWFASLSLTGTAQWRIRAMSTYSQTIGEALRGKGLALGSTALLESEISSGALVRLSNSVLRTERGYYLCHGERSVPSEKAIQLSEFLLAAALAQRDRQKARPTAPAATSPGRLRRKPLASKQAP